MLKKSKIILLTIVVIIAGFFIYVKNIYVMYRPHYLTSNNEEKYYGKPELDSIEFQNVIHVLEFYNEDYKIKSKNVILITKHLSMDWSLLYNYTIKSNDIEWLSSH